MCPLGSATKGSLPSAKIDSPTMYFHDRSHTHVSAEASFSICTYLVSVGVIALDVKETGRQELSS